MDENQTKIGRKSDKMDKNWTKWTIDKIRQNGRKSDKIDKLNSQMSYLCWIQLTSKGSQNRNTIFVSRLLISNDNDGFPIRIRILIDLVKNVFPILRRRFDQLWRHNEFTKFTKITYFAHLWLALIVNSSLTPTTFQVHNSRTVTTDFFTNFTFGMQGKISRNPMVSKFLLFGLNRNCFTNVSSVGFFDASCLDTTSNATIGTKLT